MKILGEAYSRRLKDRMRCRNAVTEIARDLQKKHPVTKEGSTFHTILGDSEEENGENVVVYTLIEADRGVQVFAFAHKSSFG